MARLAIGKEFLAEYAKLDRNTRSAVDTAIAGRQAVRQTRAAIVRHLMPPSGRKPDHVRHQLHRPTAVGPTAGQLGPSRVLWRRWTNCAHRVMPMDDLT